MTESPRLPFPEVEHLRPVYYAPELTLAERAARFHAENPHVLRLVVTLARRVVDRGRGHGSINMIFETLRWHYLETHGDVYRLNNSYRAWYAREAMRVDPRLAGFFSTREGPHDAEYADREVR
jgi:hypothetical protein